MEGAGIDISISSDTLYKELPVLKQDKQIFKAADWSSEGILQKFYHRELERGDITKFGIGVLPSQGTSNHTC